ncbi:uncharacterized protein [Chamaea fasciata]|uniref:uncharacterized protein n=1 Tax=Chamaea fasciata TaxID=190680 RepID=UPI00336A33B5
MDLHVRLTWLLLLSSTLLSEPASGAWWNRPDGDPNSIWNKFSDWIKEKFQQKASLNTTASIPSTTTTTTEESRTSENSTAPQTASNLSPAALVRDVTTPAGKVLSTLAQATASPAAEPAAVTTPTASPAAEPADLAASTASPAAEPADVTASAASPTTAPANITTTTVPSGTAPADITPAPAEGTTPGAAVTTKPTAAENPATSSPTPSVPPTPGVTTAIATTHPKTNAATKGPADPNPLPDSVRRMLLAYLNIVCQPRRPGMPEITLEGCVKDPTCGQDSPSGQRLVRFPYRAAGQPRACVQCKVSGCQPRSPAPRPYPGNRFPPVPFQPYPGNRVPLPRPYSGNRFPPVPPQRFPGNRLPPPGRFPSSRRAKRSTNDKVVVVIVPQ